MNNLDDKIDFILIWVDGSDVEWQKARNKYAGKSEEDTADYRFRDWDNLKYWFRGIEKFAPWVNNIYFITCGHYPEWLNLNHPKLKFVKHEDYIPSEYLPTFNSHTIELNFNKIPELSEKFVYFNDDMFLIDNVEKEDFFIKNKPKYIAALEAVAMTDEKFGHILLNNTQLVNRHYNSKEVMKANKLKWYYPGYGFKNLIKTAFLSQYCCFTSFYNSHIASPILKSTMDDVWKNEFDKLDSTCKSRFRSEDNVNQYVFNWWEIAKGNFVPQKNSFGSFYRIGKDNTRMLDDIKNQKHKTICLNDVSNDFDFEKAKEDIISAFESILPEKSEFEK